MTGASESFGLEFTLNYIDYELYPPTQLDQRRARFDAFDSFHQTVPIIRIFGRTDAGQNVCALVHGVYPYMYIEYDGSTDQKTSRISARRLDDDADWIVDEQCLRLHRNINVTLATTYRRNPHDDGSTFVADVTVCKAVPFYGLYAAWRAYYKISLLSPKHMSRLADLFRAGSILDRPCQPFESHVPYLLQFMIDYNLYGCNAVRCRDVTFRVPLPNPPSSKDSSLDMFSDKSARSLHGHSLLTVKNVPDAVMLDGGKYSRASRSEIECDVLAVAIMNRSALEQRQIHHDLGVEAAFVMDPKQRFLPSLTELWHEDARRREALGLEPSRSQLPKSNVRQRSNVWNNEQELKDSLHDVLQRQRAAQVDKNKIDGYSQAGEVFNHLPTSFESVQISCDTHLATTRANLAMLGKEPSALVPVVKSQEKPLIISQHTSNTDSSAHDSYAVERPESAFQNAEDSDVYTHIVESQISQFLTRPLRLRGGAATTSTLVFATAPPNRLELKAQDRDATSSDFPEPYYGDVTDVPLLAKDYAANGMMPGSHSVPHLQDFFQLANGTTSIGGLASSVMHFAMPPPSRQHLATTKAMADTIDATTKVRTQIALPTQISSVRAQEDNRIAKVTDADVPLSVLSIELHAQSRGILLPNPTSDPVFAIFWAFRDFGLSEAISEGSIISTQYLDRAEALSKLDPAPVIVDTELELIQALIDLVLRLDPDAVLSFEMQNSSLGYLEERTKLTFSFSALNEMGRLMPDEKEEPGYNDRWGETHATSVKVSGRHVLNLWRIMRSEMNLLQYTLENVAYHQLRLRIPKYSHADLHRWLTSGRAGPQQRVLRYYAHRTRLNIIIIDSQGLLSRVSEQARLLGIDFYSVFSRGSQFKVESLMCRIAKPECFILLSPSKKQVAQQNALECIPLVMEPQSRFYHDPVLVLDFQSLYPSIMIAYNFCYSTCLGKLGYKGLESKLGVTYYTPNTKTMQELAADIEIAPNGVLYTKDHRRKSLLAKMLYDLLETRAMVKEGMKMCKNDRASQRLMHNRQLALKLIANVTYGYTSASFSGRMPCADIADSIVQTGRETLEKAIEFIHNHATWNAEVVYGDTDSLFVKLPGRSKTEAFHIGSQMATEITKMSPSPVKLKFEKVYLPCILLAKKRYVGFKYESPMDTEPVFDAKGIETVRRDGTPAEQKIEEMALKIMFRTGDLSAVKDFFQQECWKIMTGRCSLHDFCFAKEVKLGTYSTKGVPPPGAVISAKSIAADPRSEPQYGERVSYLVISGASRSRLTDRCVPPEELLLNPDLRLDVEYYITKNIIPPLDRLFSIMGVNVRSWYDEMPRSLKMNNRGTMPVASKTSSKIETFLTINHCPVCQQELSKPGICLKCLSDPPNTYYDLQRQSTNAERTHKNVLRICSSCCAIPVHAEVACVSKDCPVYYKRVSIERKVDVDLATRTVPLFENL